MLKNILTRKFRYFQRQFKKKEYMDLESCAKSRHAEMWQKLNKLNSPPTTRAALEIIREDKTISRDLKEILERWFFNLCFISGINPSDWDLVT